MVSKVNYYEQQDYRISRAGLSSRHQKVLEIAAKYCSGSQISRVLDIGCLDGTFSMMLGRQLMAREVYGVDISQANVENAQAKGCNAIAFDLDTGHLPFDDASYDFIHVGDVIEHLYNPDNLLKEIRRLLTADGLCIITTPNLAALANRVVLLFGYQPFPMGTSLEHDPGKLLISNPLLLGGHIRVFTYRAICQLCRLHNLRVAQVIGMPMSLGGQTKRHVSIVRTLERALLSKTLYRVFPSLAWDLLLVTRKQNLP
jgi:methionine biosynthesis protein MetW